MSINYHCQLGLSIVRIDAATNSCRRVGSTASYGLWVRVSNLIAHSLIDWLIVGGCAAERLDFMLHLHNLSCLSRARRRAQAAIQLPQKLKWSLSVCEDAAFPWQGLIAGRRSIGRGSHSQALVGAPIFASSVGVFSSFGKLARLRFPRKPRKDTTHFEIARG